jgi:hypothetical protein
MKVVPGNTDSSGRPAAAGRWGNQISPSLRRTLTEWQSSLEHRRRYSTLRRTDDRPFPPWKKDSIGSLKNL